jgi:O-antigen/teichoic acid export membrane protein
MFKTDFKTAQAKVLSGSAVLLTGSGLVTGINFAYNVAVAQFLGPDGFGQATAVYTLLILLSAVTLSFQIVSAKVVAQQQSPEAKGAAFRAYHRQAWVCGIVLAALLVLFRNVVSEYLNLPSSNLVTFLAAGLAFYVPLGAKRGYIQGACSFRNLATNLVLEGFVRLTGSLLLILLGYGVPGVIAANAAAVAVAYIFALPKIGPGAASTLHIDGGFREGLQAIVFFVGQVGINNCDIVVVKHFFDPTSAGLYAAVALVGRVVFAFSWAVISTMFPVAASHRQEDRRDGILSTAALLVFAIGSILTLSLRLAPAWLWTLMFGSRFVAAGGHNLPFLLSLYAATTTVYALCVVFIAYEMSYKIANTGWVQLAFCGVLIAGMYRFHSSLEQVIRVQLIMMTLLLVAVAVPFAVNWMRRRGREGGQVTAISQELHIVRRASENEVIAAFLKNDFQNPEFENYQRSLGEIVAAPDLNDSGENSLRRALFFIRHGALWRELPKGTEWFEVEISQTDLNQIRVFPRAQWRKLARGNFALPRIVRSLADGGRQSGAEEAFLAKIQDLCAQVRQETVGGAVLLIGRNESGPFTVLDGNHRLAAAMLVSPKSFAKFRFYCGLSPRMAECCWYETNTATLLRYATNLLRHLVHDPEAELERLLQNPETRSLV